MYDVRTMTDESINSHEGHKRRPRYGGTHPKRFEQKYKERDPEKYPEVRAKLRAKGKTPAGTHVPVLFREVMDELRPCEGETVADCTLGYGGHAEEFLRRVGPGGRVVGFDVDGAELAKTTARLVASGAATAANFSTHRMNFAGIGQVLAAEGLAGFDVIFADLGVSSMQVDDPSRGISYKHSGPLDMRLDGRLTATGASVLATIGQAELSRALWELSDEEDHETIAQWIVNQRQAVPIETTDQLSRLVLNAKGFSPAQRHKPWQVPGGLHPAAKTFQALRILVNDELGALRALLRAAPYILKPGGRVGVISFHSGEDRLVKQDFRELHRQGIYDAISEHVITPSPPEVRANPRSASAKFRWARRKNDARTRGRGDAERDNS